MRNAHFNFRKWISSISFLRIIFHFILKYIFFSFFRTNSVVVVLLNLKPKKCKLRATRIIILQCKWLAVLTKWQRKSKLFYFLNEANKSRAQRTKNGTHSQIKKWMAERKRTSAWPICMFAVFVWSICIKSLLDCHPPTGIVKTH